MSKETWTAFDPVDFHATSAHAHSKIADGHAQSAMEGNAVAYMHHLNAAKAHDEAAKAHMTTSKMLPLPVNASPPHEGTPIATAHPIPATPVTAKPLGLPSGVAKKRS